MVTIAPLGQPKNLMIGSLNEGSKSGSDFDFLMAPYGGVNTTYGQIDLLNAMKWHAAPMTSMQRGVQ